MNVLLKNRSLILLGLAESVSGMGTWITMIALYALIVFEGQGGVAESSGIMLAGLGPMLIFSPLAGWLCDRYDRKWLMIASQFLAALPILALMFVERLWLVYLLLAIQAIFASLMTPARQAAIPAMVERTLLTRANAFLQQLASFIKIGAPIMAGVIVAALGAQQALILDVLSFGIAGLILLLLPSLPPSDEVSEAQEAQEAETVPSRLASEEAATPSLSLLKALRDSAQLRLLFITIFMGIVIIMGFDVLAAIYIRDVLHSDEGLFGLMIGLVGFGSLLSVAWLMMRKGEHDPWHDLLWGILLLSCIPAFLAIGDWVMQPNFARLLTIIGCLLGGIGNGLTTVQISTLLQLLSPPALLGRMSGVFQSTIVAGQLIAIFTTPLLVPTLLSIGTYFALATLALWIISANLALTQRAALTGSISC